MSKESGFNLVAEPVNTAENSLNHQLSGLDMEKAQVAILDQGRGYDMDGIMESAREGSMPESQDFKSSMALAPKMIS